ELLQTFWRIHNPTTRNRQGFDFGSQYRSAIFYHDADQHEAAIASRDAEQQSLRRQIVTQITPASALYRAEEDHQRYLEKHGRPSCAATARYPGRAQPPPPPRTTTTGQNAPVTQWMLTEPTSMPVNAPCPWLPTTSRSASFDASIRTCAGCP